MSPCVVRETGTPLHTRTCPASVSRQSHPPHTNSPMWRSITRSVAALTSAQQTAGLVRGPLAWSSERESRPPPPSSPLPSRVGAIQLRPEPLTEAFTSESSSALSVSASAEYHATSRKQTSRPRTHSTSKRGSARTRRANVAAASSAGDAASGSLGGGTTSPSGGTTSPSVAGSDRSLSHAKHASASASSLVPSRYFRTPSSQPPSAPAAESCASCCASCCTSHLRSSSRRRTSSSLRPPISTSSLLRASLLRSASPPPPLPLPGRWRVAVTSRRGPHICSVSQ
mmetsp:Transcript_2461/g.8030  ORF Transcript_2461/g.8030 Transcript_2461/m.8030 type:complete len:284 (+) Transcript_2461:35-886(+)